jgi:hypothetical protein
MESSQNKKKKQNSTLTNNLDYYETFEPDDFSLYHGCSQTRGSSYKSKGGKGRNKREMRKANSGKTCYSSKHVRIQSERQSKTI